MPHKIQILGVLKNGWKIHEIQNIFTFFFATNMYCTRKYHKPSKIYCIISVYNDLILCSCKCIISNMRYKNRLAGDHICMFELQFNCNFLWIKFPYILFATSSLIDCLSRHIILLKFIWFQNTDKGLPFVKDLIP